MMMNKEAQLYFKAPLFWPQIVSGPSRSNMAKSFQKRFNKMTETIVLEEQENQTHSQKRVETVAPEGRYPFLPYWGIIVSLTSSLGETISETMGKNGGLK